MTNAKSKPKAKPIVENTIEYVMKYLLISTSFIIIGITKVTIMNPKPAPRKLEQVMINVFNPNKKFLLFFLHNEENSTVNNETIMEKRITIIGIPIRIINAIINPIRTILIKAIDTPLLYSRSPKACA